MGILSHKRLAGIGKPQNSLGAAWGKLLAAGWLGLNAVLLLHPPTRVLLPVPEGGGHDYLIWAQVPARLVAETLYDATPGYHYIFAPAMAWILAVIIPLGYPFWWALHLAVLMLLRDSRLIGLVLLSAAFWVDTMLGSTTVFVFVAGSLALRGSTIGTVAFFALFLLMLRPVHFPLAAWLAWKRPDVRWTCGALVGLLVITTLASGYTSEWLIELLVFSGFTMSDANYANLAPTRWLGPAWLVIGGPLAFLLTMKGKLGLAGLAMSPYFGAPYLLNLLWDIQPYLATAPRLPPSGSSSKSSRR